MAGFDGVLIDGARSADFLAALHSEVAAGFKLSATPGNVHPLKLAHRLPGIVRAGPRRATGSSPPPTKTAGIKLFSDTRSILEEFEDSGEVRAAI